MSENTRPILRPLPSGIGRPSWLALLVVATIALGFGAANGYGAGVRSAGAPPASGGGPASPTPAPSTGPSTSAAPSGPVARLTCTPDPNAFDLGDPCPSALEAVERAVAPLGQAVSAIDIEPGPFLCDQLWPGVGRDQCFGTFVRPGRFMHAWAEFMDSPRIAAISLARDGPTVPAASSASSAPSAWRATVEAYEIPPQGWAFPSAPIASPSPNPSTGPAATTFREWTRIDLPDPAPDVFGGATPTGLVAFRGSYITIGTVWAGCCDGDASLDRGVLWASTDGRSWTVRDRIAAFARAAVTGLVSDGIRLVAVGYVAAPVPDELGIPEAALWMSLDGAHWTRAAGPVPSLVAAGRDGFVGVVSSRNQDGSDPRAYFVRSADGLTWRRTSLTFRASVRGLVVGLDGSALAVGAVGGTPLADGSPTEDMLAWRSDDGRIWTGPQLVAHEAGPFAASAGPDGDGLVALVRTPERSPGGTLNDATQLWLLLEGTAPRITTFPLREGEYLSSVFVLGRTVLAIGAGETGAMVWVSTDGGETFGRVADQPSLVANSTDFTGLVEVPGGALAVGRSWDEFTGHPVPLAWLADR